MRRTAPTARSPRPPGLPGRGHAPVPGRGRAGHAGTAPVDRAGRRLLVACVDLDVEPRGRDVEITAVGAAERHRRRVGRGQLDDAVEAAGAVVAMDGRAAAEG